MTRIRTAGAVCAALLVLILSTSAFAQMTFTQQSYKTNDGASMAVADVNGDGKPDIVITHEFGNAVDVYLNQGNGTFQDLGSASYLTGPEPLQVVIGDFNADGKPDVATLNCAPTQTPQGTVSFLYGNGDGTFQTHVDIAPNGNQNCPISIAVMKDPTGDKLAVTAGTTTPVINIYSAKDPANITVVNTITLAPGSGIGPLVSGDYNHDGIADLATNITNSSGTNSIVTFLSSGGSYVQTTVPVTPPAGTTLTVAHTIDANGDGVDDLGLVASGSASGAVAMVLINNGNGTAWTSRTLTVPGTFSGASDVVAADFNGDGLNDILVLAQATETGSDAYGIFPATSSTTWGSPQVINSPSRIVLQKAAAADFNGDNKPDFAALSTFDAMVHVFTNTTTTQASCSPPPKSGIGICSPTSGSTVTSPVQIAYSATSLGHTITAMKVYIDGKLVASSSSNVVRGSSVQPNGPHVATVNAWNEAGTLIQAKVSFTVSSGGPPPACAINGVGVQICSPAANSTVNSPVQLTAAAAGNGKTITAMKAYVDGTQVASSASGNLSASVNVANGTHSLVVNAWDTGGTLYQAKQTFSVGTSAPPPPPPTSCAPPSTAGETVCSPAAGATVSSPVQISAAANGGGKTVTAMKAYVDGVQVAASTSGTLNASVNVAAGSHTLDVNSWTSGVLLATHHSTFTVQ